VYDLDTELPFPCPFQQFMEEAIHSDMRIREEFRRYVKLKHRKMK
jgi:hypothetical protein